jgi:hypothetical protein
MTVDSSAAHSVLEQTVGRSARTNQFAAITKKRGVTAAF